MVTAAALAHVNRLPCCSCPATSSPAGARSGTPADRGFRRSHRLDQRLLLPGIPLLGHISRPEQLISSLPRAIQVLTDPPTGPVTLALPRDVQAMAYDYPAAWFLLRIHRLRRPGPDGGDWLRQPPCHGGAKPSSWPAAGCTTAMPATPRRLCRRKHRIPVAETQNRQERAPWNHAQNVGAISVTGSAAANALAAEADVVLAVGTRLADFTTGSRAVFRHPEPAADRPQRRAFDAAKHHGQALVADARRGLD